MPAKPKTVSERNIAALDTMHRRMLSTLNSRHANRMHPTDRQRLAYDVEALAWALVICQRHQTELDLETWADPTPTKDPTT
jgi:hypothetical protein